MDALTSIKTVEVVFEVDDAMNALNLQYDLDELKSQIDKGSSIGDKHKILERIIDDYGSSILQCDAFALFVETDPWRALRDLRQVDPLRASLTLRSDNPADSTPLVYPDVCFVTPFWKYQPEALD